MTKVEKIAELIKTKFGFDAKPETFTRTRAGHWQRTQGAWSWWMECKGYPMQVGSCTGVTEILQNKENLVLYGDEIVVEDHKVNI